MTTATLETTKTGFSQDTFNQYVMNTYGRFPVAIEKGEGCKLWDTEDKEYLDFVAGIATCTLGHAHPALVEAVTKQIKKLHHISNLYYIPEQGELAKWIVDHSCADKVFFCNSGAEANEAAIKLVRKYAHTVLEFLEQPVILTAKSSFHGRTLATITATGQPKYQKNFEPLVPGFEYVPYNDITAIEEAITDIDEGDRRVAAIMIEPLQGEGGVRPGELEYFLRLRKICDDTGILLVFDEVQTGVGRTGKMWGYENLGIEPDIITSAKGLAGGIPIGAMMCKASCDVFEPGNHASTFGGNPFACASALAVLQTIEKDNLLQNVQARGEQLRTRLRAIAQKYSDIFIDVRGWGLINGMEINNNAELTSIEVVKKAMENGLLLAPAGPKVIRFVPPLIVSAEEIDQGSDILEKTVSQLI
ncbi:aspartate aminotransferase family protein [Cyanobacterium aponinum UTEX 3222]|uniref:Acetylornithine aminotransferase n=1 Tax=Cyanobacterium aponinum AL20115 TaxID=3090662 RepID=A0AAF0ZC47_9CHRO|nr:aspartate aminotransferase family protein [Cyanobacterium aponinum]MBD2394925.1 aspartate aminotransferase family protein [Cyanobacterium aponinum FACHB-4101]PHV63634.1 aspartate aminotransferase family protein [Cyanobacterium aponinum IPPAS B-1201]WPF88274.1 aspartate aminotransferase family protein [Cyanobacterium aponinum AL20115]WRL42888.1 aspartate aminotransferase family protein [Cyanobacterium aponinum UTEX 3222]